MFNNCELNAVPNILNDLSKKERNIYVACLLFILNLNKKQNKNNDYVLSRIKDLGLDESILDKVKKISSEEDVYKLINTISNVKARRYILREMILVAISNHELTDDEVATIYNIGLHVGIKTEKINDFFLWAAKGLEWEIEGIQLIEGDL